MKINQNWLNCNLLHYKYFRQDRYFCLNVNQAFWLFVYFAVQGKQGSTRSQANHSSSAEWAAIGPHVWSGYTGLWNVRHGRLTHRSTRKVLLWTSVHKRYKKVLLAQQKQKKLVSIQLHEVIVRWQIFTDICRPASST